MSDSVTLSMTLSCIFVSFGRILDLYPEINISGFSSPVTVPPATDCTSHGRVVLTQPSGFLSSYLIRNSVLNRLSCPIVLEAAPGQTWNLTLLDFGLPRGSSDTGIGLHPCHKYGVAKEMTSPVGGQIEAPLCGGTKRNNTIFRSIGNRLSLELEFPDGVEYIVQYSGKGTWRSIDVQKTHNAKTLSPNLIWEAL